MGLEATLSWNSWAAAWRGCASPSSRGESLALGLGCRRLRCVSSHPPRLTSPSYTHTPPCRLPSPATFAKLTRLTLLSLDTVGEEREAFDEFPAALEATLVVLPQLQHLRCTFASPAYVGEAPCMPLALTSLHSLQRLWWDIALTDDASLPGPSDAWLRGLRHLALTAAVVTANHARLLAATPLLERLDVLVESSAVNNLPLLCAVQHPSVRHVNVELPYHGYPTPTAAAEAAAMAPALAQATQQRPDVRFTCDTEGLWRSGLAFDGAECSLWMR